MISEIQKKIKEASSFKSKDPKEIEKFRLKFLGKKGHISYFFSEFKKGDNSLLADLKIITAILQQIAAVRAAISPK